MPNADTEPASPGTTQLPITIRISGVAYFTVLMTALVAIILAGTSMLYLGWVLVLPILQAFWIRRLRTVVDADGITAHATFRTETIAWPDLDGLQFPKWGAVRAVRTDSSSVKLPAVGFADLPALSMASGGRIPNPYDGVDELA